MICWDRCGDVVVGVFDEYEIVVLRSYAESLLRLLEHRARAYSPAGPDTALTDPRLLAILRDRLGPGEPEWTLAWHETSCLGFVAETLRAVLETLPERGGHVRVDSRAGAESWLRATEIYLVVLTAVADEAGRVAGRDAEPTVEWLAGIVGGLTALLATEARPAARG
ncbi:hypothetical protein [Lentzea sp. CA-135723]|uniref:DUF2017 family protein n=1 Tax=Lentzea sp. CA-135723 TaxID=3239950 RepID=UPI003D8D6FB6